MMTMANNYPRIAADMPPEAGGIWPVLHKAPYTLETIAPERRSELAPLLGGLTIRLRQSDEVRAYATTHREIVLTRGLADCLWCAAYAYYVFRLEIERQIRERGNWSVIAADQGEPIDSAFRLLGASLVSAAGGGPVEWGTLPQPVPPTEPQKDSALETKVGEMTLGALGFILHHELAHVRLGHVAADAGSASWTLDQEREADTAAIDWILGMAFENERAVAKRAWAVVIPTTFLTALHLVACRDGASVAGEQQTHPHPYDRLDKVIQHDAVQRSDLLRTTMTSLACASLIPHIRMAEVTISEGPYEDYPELYEACLDALANVLGR